MPTFLRWYFVGIDEHHTSHMLFPFTLGNQPLFVCIDDHMNNNSYLFLLIFSIISGWLVFVCCNFPFNESCQLFFHYEVLNLILILLTVFRLMAVLIVESAKLSLVCPGVGISVWLWLVEKRLVGYSIENLLSRGIQIWCSLKTCFQGY